jgi:hypothetical protein
MNATAMNPRPRLPAPRAAAVVLCAAVALSRPTPAANQGGPEPGHPFACADYSAGKIFVVDAAGKVEFEFQTQNCNDLWVLPNGNLLFNTGRGVKEVKRDGSVAFSYETTSEVYACQRLANGNTFVGECNAGRLLELAPDGKIVKETRLIPPGETRGHGYMRNARRLADGHFLVTHYDDEAVREYDADGHCVRTIPAKGGPHSAVRLANGHTLVSCGDRPGGRRVFEADATGKAVWEVGEKELPGIELKFVAGLQRLPNGNTVLCNWLGHGAFGSGPHLIEVTPAKTVVWTFTNHTTMRTISSVQLLDVPGDATRYEIQH